MTFDCSHYAEIHASCEKVDGNHVRFCSLGEKHLATCDDRRRSKDFKCSDTECVCNNQPAWVPDGCYSVGGKLTRKGHPEFYAATDEL